MPALRLVTLRDRLTGQPAHRFSRQGRSAGDVTPGPASAPAQVVAGGSRIRRSGRIPQSGHCAGNLPPSGERRVAVEHGPDLARRGSGFEAGAGAAYRPLRATLSRRK